MNFFAYHLAKADAGIKLNERENRYYQGMSQDKVDVENNTMLVELKLDRLEKKILNARECRDTAPREDLKMLDEAAIEGAEAQKEVLEEWLNEKK